MKDVPKAMLDALYTTRLAEKQEDLICLLAKAREIMIDAIPALREGSFFRVRMEKFVQDITDGETLVYVKYPEVKTVVVGEES